MYSHGANTLNAANQATKTHAFAESGLQLQTPTLHFNNHSSVEEAILSH